MLLTSLSLLALALPSILAAPTSDNGTIWAVLVAGSNGWDNYRHQADVCHAYQIFRSNGVPDSQIIVMMYDDIAENDENPHKGKIINKPNGPNVYENVPKDYTGDQVNKKNFINILTGNTEALKGIGSGKALGSGKNDHVFINYVDHGGTGLIGFPDGDLTADKLIKTLKKMHKKKMYKQMVFYMEACESGSMFKNLLSDDIGIYATTASNAKESSWGCYCDNKLNTCLGDVYSVTWMNDIDSEIKKGKFSTETLKKQFKILKKKVKESHVQKYGDTSFTKEDLSEVFGDDENSTTVYLEDHLNEITDVVPSRDIPIYNLQNKIKHTNDVTARKELQEKLEILIQGRKSVDDLFSNILDSLTTLKSPQRIIVEDTHHELNMEMFPCYTTLLEGFKDICININKNTYAMAHMYKLANLCTLDTLSPEEVLDVFALKCTDSHRSMKGIN